MSSYDYIVVGAGSAGAVVAGRLTEDPSTKVLLVEAGGSHKHLNVQVPAAFSKQFRTKLDWEYYTEPEAELGGRKIYHPRAKMLGGCSSMNAMIYIRGNRHDYDSWAKGGATGWSYDEVLPLFRRSEANSRGESVYHGGDGPLHIEDPRSPNALSQKIVDATRAYVEEVQGRAFPAAEHSFKPNGFVRRVAPTPKPAAPDLRVVEDEIPPHWQTH